jgi:diacylglycerol kinase family enzyme
MRGKRGPPAAGCRARGNPRRPRHVEDGVSTRLIDQQQTSIRRVHAVINPASGGVGPGAAGELAALFAELGLAHRVDELAPGRFDRGVRAAVETGPDLVVVLGGDGTARRVAEACGPRGPLVAPLSGGTMNKLGHALYGARPWREALRGLLTDGQARWMPGGEVGGHAFYCSAVLGPPALWAPAREEIRARRLGRARRRAAIAYRRAFLARLRYRFDSGETGRGLALALICPTTSRALAENEEALEAAVLNVRDARAGVRLALSNLFGDWRDDPDVSVRPCLRARAWAREPIPAMLDGEFFRLGRRVEARFRPHAFRALAPREPVLTGGRNDAG